MLEVLPSLAVLHKLPLVLLPIVLNQVSIADHFHLINRYLILLAETSPKILIQIKVIRQQLNNGAQAPIYKGNNSEEN